MSDLSDKREARANPIPTPIQRALRRAAWAQERQDNKRVAQYVRLGMTPGSAERLVADERARESAAVAMIVRDTEAMR